MKSVLILCAFLLAAGTGITNARDGSPAETPEPQQAKSRITGTVVDRTGEPVIGANIVEKGVAINGSITDVDGKFSLEVSPGATLTVSYIGYVTLEVAVANRTTLNITLEEDTRVLEEVVVVGYGTQRKESLTSAITSVNTELLESRSIPKLATALQGITPGVYIRQTVGRPGYSAATVDIRGASMGTFSSNGALVLIDGVVGGIDDVNPNDVENISILKDAAAAAIYGSRATGGVVLITTKKGTAGKTTVTYQGTFGAQQSMLANWKNKFVDSQTWMRANNEAFLNDGGTAPYTEEMIAQYDGSDPAKPARTQVFDWMETPMQYQHDISVRGGTEKLKTYLSAGYLSQDGLLPNDDYRKFTFLGNLNWKPFERLEIAVNAFYSKENTTRPAGGGVGQQVRALLIAAPIYPFYYPNGHYYTGTAYQSLAEGGNILYDYDRYRISADLKFELFKDLFLKYTLSSNNFFNRENSFTRIYALYDEAGGITGTNRAYSTASESWGATQYLSHLVSLDYSIRTGDHSITAFAGFQAETNRQDNISASRNRFINNELRELSASVGSGLDFTGNSSADEWAMASLIGRATYAFKDRYILEGTVRYDGSSRFSPKQRWALFPSASAAWRIREEAFMKDVDWLSNLKLRATWGKLGNQGSALYPFATTVGRGSYAFGGGTVTTTSTGTPPDLDLSWETKTTANLALDFGLLDSRLSGSFDWYYDRTKDIIGTPTVSSLFGASAPVQNTYTIDNRGWELELTWRDRIGDVTYTVGGNISDSRDKVVSLGGLGSTDPRYDGGHIVIGGTTYYAEGRPRNGFYLYQTDGLFVDQNEIDNSVIPPNGLTRPGDIKFIDRNGDNQLNSDDRYFSTKTTTPHYFYGFHLGAEYKGFDFTAVFNGVGERWDIRVGDGHYTTGNRHHFNLFQSNYDNRWSPENPDKWADQPRLTDNNWISGEFSTLFGSPTEYHLRNYKYIRLKNLQAGYTLPRQLTEKCYVSRLRVFFTGENLFYHAPGYTEYTDPESVLSTTDGGNSGTVYYGPSKVFSGGVSITF
ncbi:MAG: TonB-dependent receptor [Tannerella sp.]|nr:TonB-dependent receptor [Tannerella sp.]